MSAETDKQRIDRLASTLQGLQTGNLLTWDELDVWAELVYFLCPDRLNNSSTSNDEIFTTFEHHLKQKWADRELRASILLFYSISVQCTVGISSRRGKLTSDDSLGDAIDLNAFHFIYTKILSIHKFHECYAAVELIDLFIKYFITHCPERLQEMFNICEEELAAIEDFEYGHTAASAPIDKYPLHFKVLLNLIRRLYSGQTTQLTLLAKQFFSPDFEHLGHFIRSGIAISSPALYVDYVTMLEALCKAQPCANFLFRHFNSNHEILYDWAGLFGSLRRYVEVFRRRLPINQNSLKSEIEAPQMIRRQDLLASVAWIRLATTIAKHDPQARRYFVFGNHFNSIDTLVSAVTSFMPVVLKGEIFKLLAALAADENSVIQIWNVLMRDSVCVFGEQPGRLVGIQTEFEEVECVNKTYDSAFGFLHLVRALFSRRYLPDSKVIAPYVYFVTKSIICQCDSRAYESIQQMWDMLNVAFDALFQFIRRFHISAATVSRKTPQVFVLAQLLSDSDLSRALVRIITDCADKLENMFDFLGRTDYTDDYPIALSRNEASNSALRLISYAIDVHPALRASLRTATETTAIFIAPLESILLTPLSSSSTRNYAQLLSSFIDEQDVLLPHTFYVVRALRKVAASQSAETHAALLRSFQQNAPILKWIFARLIAVRLDETKEKSVDSDKGKKAEMVARELEVSDQDLVPFELTDVKNARLRGEIARELLELFTDVLDAVPGQPNLTYLLFGYNFDDFYLSRAIVLDENKSELNCMHSLIDLIQVLCEEKEPYAVPYSALFEPALRLLERLCSAGCLSSEPTLRYLRNSYNLIHRLAHSSIFQSAQEDLSSDNDKNEEEPGDNDKERVSVHLATFNRQLRGMILQLIAIDFTASMRNDHIGLPTDYMSILLSTRDENSRAILWSLMYNSISASLDITTPAYRNFEMTRVDEVLKSCLRRSPSGLQEYDVEMVHFVLSEEINSIVNCDVTDVKKEANEILLYCVQYNAQRRLERSCAQVLSSWVAFVNAMVAFAPLPFIDLGIQEQIFNDVLVVLKDYLEAVTVPRDALEELSKCLLGLVQRLVQFACLRTDSKPERKNILQPIHSVLTRCSTLNKYNYHFHFKKNLDNSISCLLAAYTETKPPTSMLPAQGSPLAFKP